MLQPPKNRFKLNDNFLEEFIGKQPNWGPLGYITYARTYARDVNSSTERISDLAKQYSINGTEEYWLTCTRVIEGVYNIQKAHCEHLKLPWNNTKAQSSAQEMFRRMWEFKWTPPGRGLWMMGVDHLWSIGGMALRNCSFVSTQNIKDNLSEPFCYMMDASMLGVGVGFDTNGAGSVTIKSPKLSTQTMVIEDSRQGWVESLRTLLDSFTGKKVLPTKFDFSLIRKKGEPIKGFGGISSGPSPLIELHKTIYEILTETRPNFDETTLVLEFPQTNFNSFPITSTHIVDIFNLVGKCVVSGNVRRSAQLAVGSKDDNEFIALKTDPELLKAHRWCSNNSIFAEIGMDYTKYAELAAINGEPGFLYLENAQKYGRLIDPPDNKDRRVQGWNPCIKADALMLTSQGLTKAENIKLGDKLWTGHSWSPVVKIWNNGIKDTYEFRTDYGSFYGTKNHKVYSNGHLVEIEKAETIDIVDYQIPKSDFTYKDISNIPYYKMGIAYAVGKFNEKSTSYYYETDIYNSIPTIDLNSISLELKNMSSDFSSRLIKEDLEEWSTDNIRSFLSGILSVKAKFNKISETIKFSLYNYEFSKQVQMLLGTLGILSYIKKTKYHNTDKYFITIPSDQLNKLYEQLNFTNNKVLLNQLKKQYGKEQPALLKRSAAIKETKYLGQDVVYDFMVQDEKHTIWFNNLLISNCTEIALQDMECCNVPETFPINHESLEDYLITLKYAYLYGKTVTLLPSHNEKVNQIEMANRRIGLSQSGIVQNINKIGLREHMKWCDEGYKFLDQLDEEYSRWLCIPKSIKKTSIKPSGSTSLLPGVTPGIHWPEAEYYIRNIRFSDISPIVEACRKAGYKIEKDVYTPDTVVISFPIKEKHFKKSKKDVTIWEQMELNAQIQAYWADNGVSQTTTVRPGEEKEIANVLAYYETRIKGISFLPINEHGYEQAPYIAITKEEYEELSKNLQSIVLKESQHEVTEKFCTNDSCEIDFSKLSKG